MKRKIVFGSVLILGYFISLQLLSYFDIKVVIIGVFVELLTIPFLLGIPVLLFLSIKFWKKENWILKSSYVISVIALLISIIIVLI